MSEVAGPSPATTRPAALPQSFRVSYWPILLQNDFWRWNEEKVFSHLDRIGNLDFTEPAIRILLLPNFPAGPLLRNFCNIVGPSRAFRRGLRSRMPAAQGSDSITSSASASNRPSAPRSVATSSPAVSQTDRNARPTPRETPRTAMRLQL